jgi:hypothetical protein
VKCSAQSLNFCADFIDTACQFDVYTRVYFSSYSNSDADDIIK